MNLVHLARIRVQTGPILTSNRLDQANGKAPATASFFMRQVQIKDTY